MTSFINEKTEHVVIRIKSDEGRTIDSHEQILLKNKKVIFGKIGKGLSVNFFNQLKLQLGNKVPTFLFLAVYEGWNKPFTFVKCNLVNIYTELNQNQMSLVPKYLHSMQGAINTWFEIDKFSWIAQEEQKRICIFTSGKEITSSLRGTTAVFRVAIKGTQSFKEIPKKSFASKKLAENYDDIYQDDIEDNQEDINNIIGSRFN